MQTTDKRTQRFTFLVNAPERQLIAAIAARLDRSQADSIRFILRSAAVELQLDLEHRDLDGLQVEPND